MVDNDQWLIKLNEWKIQYNKLGKPPSIISINIDEKLANQWQYEMCKNRCGNVLSQDQHDQLNSTEGWRWYQINPRVSLFEDWYNLNNKLGKPPSSRSKNVFEMCAGRWQSEIRKEYKDNKLSQDLIDVLNGYNGWKWIDDDPFIEQLENWKIQYNKLNKILYNSPDINEQRAYTWQSYIRSNYKNNKLSLDKINQLNEVNGWKW